LAESAFGAFSGIGRGAHLGGPAKSAVFAGGFRGGALSAELAAALIWAAGKKRGFCRRALGAEEQERAAAA